MTLLISEYSILMEEEYISRISIEIRESIVLPLLVTQQYALQKIEQDSSHIKNYQKIVERSLYGNINASRNSAYNSESNLVIIKILRKQKTKFTHDKCFYTRNRFLCSKEHC